MTAAGEATGRRYRLLVVANNIDELGGLQRVAHLLSDQFGRRGHQVDLVGITHQPPAHDLRAPDAPYREHVLYDEYADPPDFREIRVRRWDVRARLRRRARKRLFTVGVRRLERLLDETRAEVVLCTQVWAMQWVAEAVRGRDVRVIGQSHESFEASAGLTPATIGSTRYTRILQLYPDIDLFLLLTAEDAVKFRQVGLNNTGVLHNPLTLRPDASADLAAPVIVSVGRYAEQKNHRALIDAFALIAGDFPEWQLRIFGDGPLREELQKQIDRLGLTDRAHLMGPTSQVADELLASSVFALSSDFEGLPLVLAEALTCGVPCVAFDCSPGIREIVTDGVDGIVVPHRDVPRLAEGMAKLMRDRRLRRRYGAAGRRNMARFDVDAIMATWEQTLATVLR